MLEVVAHFGSEDTEFYISKLVLWFLVVGDQILLFLFKQFTIFFYSVIIFSP